VVTARILVVDDEPHICRALDRLLTHEGHKVDTAGNAERALRRLYRTHYDLILLDIRMPGMSGIELYEQIREIFPTLQHKVICVTGDVSLVRQVLGGETEDAQITYSHS